MIRSKAAKSCGIPANKGLQSPSPAWTHPRRLAHTNRPTPRSALDAKFSVQYCLARALVDGQALLSHFDDGAYVDPQVARVMSRIEAAPHPQMSPSSTAHFGAEVTVTTTDGRRLAKAVDIALGRTSENPLPPSVLEAKYRDCAGRALTADAVSRSLDLLANLENVDRVAALGDILATGCASASDSRRAGCPGAGKLALGNAAAQGLVSLRRLEEIDHLAQLGHGLVDAGHVLEGDVEVFLGVELGPAAAEGQREPPPDIQRTVSSKTNPQPDGQHEHESVTRANAP